MKNILVVGQTPPPIGGQAIMIEHLVNAQFKGITIHHVRMGFSSSMDEMNKINIKKFVHLFHILYKIYYYRIFKHADILYYPPSGLTRSVYRDMVILLSTRFLFKKTIFHFHASGLHEMNNTMNAIAKFFFNVCFKKPDIAIHLSESCPQEGAYLHAKKVFIVPNGLPDLYSKYETKNKNVVPRTILFMGMLDSTKGELDIINAAKILINKGRDIVIKIAGQFGNLEYKKEFFEIINDSSLKNTVEYIGVIKGKNKEEALLNSDIFCFPTFFHSESFPLVVIEAMQFKLPIIATNWRGIPDMIENNKSGLLIEINRPDQIAESIETLIKDPSLASNMGAQGRKEYLGKYSMDKHLLTMEKIFAEL